LSASVAEALDVKWHAHPHARRQASFEAFADTSARMSSSRLHAQTPSTPGASSL
jgi:hypothetical protein